VNIEPLKVSIPDAREAVRHYARAVKERHSEEYKVLLDGYRAILRGKRVIDLNGAIASAGTDELGRPKLAVVRADCAWCQVHRIDGMAVRFESRHVRHEWLSARGRRARIQVHGFSGRLLAFGGAHDAMAPLIPPQHLPAAHRLSEYVVLFEADWQRAPVDPILLRPINHPLYAVVAAWDLTSLERAVLYDMRMKVG
jgi:hypothetical protein